MQKFGINIICLLLCCSAFAQVPQEMDSPVEAADSIGLLLPPEGFTYRDSVIYVPIPRYTDSLAARTFSETMPEGMSLSQSPQLENAMKEQIAANTANTLETEGYRIRIYFDNRQDSREASLEAEQRFRRLYPGYETYRSFIYPNFKVTVGDFRTKAEAQVALKRISVQFPTAFIVKERMKFPVICQNKRYTTDTIKVLVPLESEAPAL